MINFTVGPVQSAECVKKIGAEDCPYFRTQEFSEVMLESERLVKKFAGAPEGSRAVFITGSGTASMEATVMNVLTPQDRVLVVNGGSFGHRFCELCEVHGVPHDEIKLNVGEQIKAAHFEEVEKRGGISTARRALCEAKSLEWCGQWWLSLKFEVVFIAGEAESFPLRQRKRF